MFVVCVTVNSSVHTAKGVRLPVSRSRLFCNSHARRGTKSSDNTLDKMQQSIYYGQIGHKDAERLLGKYGEDGSFLLRDSESQHGALCLCVR